jgi:hypothetical protein
VVLAATERETTRPLLTSIARHLKERWDDSAKIPEPLPTEPLLMDDDDHIEGSADEGTTLEDLLRITGRRIKRAAPARPDKVH